MEGSYRDMQLSLATKQMLPQTACAAPQEEHTGIYIHVQVYTSIEKIGKNFLLLCRKFPVCEYRVLEHAHKGPFSKTVTMTHPLNPFNKVEHHPRVY